MTSAIDLHAGPAAGFDEPFEMLDACHQRVERMLVLLERLAAHLPLHGADDQAQQAARDVMRYFDLAAPHHHEDEERHVLPLLRAQGHTALADRVLHEHRVMHAAWAAVRAALQQIADARWVTADRGEPDWRDFCALYRAHIAVEEREVYPLARAAIDAPGVQAMAEEMACRRGVR